MSVPKAGTYHFTGRADDGIRVYVDGSMVINSWGTGVNTINHLVNLTQGNHTIRVEYFDEKYSAAIKLDLNEASMPKDAWLATYYPNKNFTGLPVKGTN
ncbi:PA14 domain-containing protein [Bacillus sp. N9]